MSGDQYLNFNSDLQYIKGIGPRRAAALAAEEINSMYDLLYNFPRRYLDRSTVCRIVDLNTTYQDLEVTVIGKVLSGELVRRGNRAFYQLLITDGSGTVKCTWFNGIRYIQKVFETGDLVAISGKPEFRYGIQFVHPDYDKLDQEEYSGQNTGRIIPLYSSSAEMKNKGLDTRGLRRIMAKIFQEYTLQVPEILPAELLEQYKILPVDEALRQIHFPDDNNQLLRARTRFKFEELFYLQLIMAVKAKGIKSIHKKFRYDGAGEKLRKIYEKLPFDLTSAQKKVIKEIWNDMKKPVVMNRLLQGDVGSGKTVVALLVSSIAISSGFQAALMAPTEILARQHFKTLQELGRPAGIKVSLLIGGQRKKERDEILQEIESGESHLIVGTHALIQDNVVMDRLALVIIDEQHRFGVEQRGKIIKKGMNPDVLVMTATPIPRTMSMTVFGDMDVSIIDEYPQGRGKVTTRIVQKSDIESIYDYTRKQIKAGGQAYIVYPLIEKSKKMDLQAAVEGFQYLSQKVFPEFSLALVHGGMKSQEKDEVMNRFKAGAVQILVSTTVIEVGVDNPNATMMIIENAERFGLTQIHQLRGRIGRGGKDGICVLVERNSSQKSGFRMEILTNTTNGFEISEEDLKLRGPGELYGTKQSGFPKMKIADVIEDKKIMLLARSEARKLIDEDTHLRRKHNQPVREHLLKYYSEYLEFLEIL
ncbi:MAG: ATP-dependent DNA helicase RecG [Candidatus Marinimicrobia bacterium]|nr:ATP-dependent DNA helicase RecG [Candidatus Neomarinimicrobiota bacterium]